MIDKQPYVTPNSAHQPKLLPPPTLHVTEVPERLAALLVASLLLVSVGLLVGLWLCWRRPTYLEVRRDASDIEVAILGADALSESLRQKVEGSGGSRSARTNDPPRHNDSTKQYSDVLALGARQGNLADLAERPNSEVGSSFMETMSELTEGIFRDSKLAGIIKLGAYEHWVIHASDIRVDNRFGGKGSFGEVRHALMYGGTEVALKTAIRVDRHSQRGVAALANEVRLLRRIRHPNIVMFYGVMLESSVQGIAMVLEWVEGSNLDRYLRPRRRVVEEGVEKEKVCKPVTPAVQSSCKLLEDVCRGMQYLHAQSPVILHRDLKPANILVEMISQPPRAKIADFGLSVLVKGVGQVGRAGTAAYMAPEVRRGELYSRGADVFSFGGVALFVLVGKNPNGHLVGLALEGSAASAGVFDWSWQPEVKAAISQVSRLCLRGTADERPDFSVALGVLSSAAIDWQLTEGGSEE